MMVFCNYEECSKENPLDSLNIYMHCLNESTIMPCSGALTQRRVRRLPPGPALGGPSRFEELFESAGVF